MLNPIWTRVDLWISHTPSYLDARAHWRANAVTDAASVECIHSKGIEVARSEVSVRPLTQQEILSFGECEEFVNQGVTDGVIAGIDRHHWDSRGAEKNVLLSLGIDATRCRSTEVTIIK